MCVIRVTAHKFRALFYRLTWGMVGRNRLSCVSKTFPWTNAAAIRLSFRRKAVGQKLVLLVRPHLLSKVVLQHKSFENEIIVEKK